LITTVTNLALSVDKQRLGGDKVSDFWCVPYVALVLDSIPVNGEADSSGVGLLGFVRNGIF
jgi:hypothetical protein